VRFSSRRGVEYAAPNADDAFHTSAPGLHSCPVLRPFVPRPTPSCGPGGTLSFLPSQDAPPCAATTGQLAGRTATAGARLEADPGILIPATTGNRREDTPSGCPKLDGRRWERGQAVGLCGPRGLVPRRDLGPAGRFTSRPSCCSVPLRRASLRAGGAPGRCSARSRRA
jgi:hypothetical protein